MYKYFKRFFDISVSLAALLVLLPIFVVVSILICCVVGRPILFKQQRAGLNGAPFYMYKFRTMKNECDSSGKLLPDIDRTFKLGSVLRSTSIDELPGLYNVLRGDMSLVGPRPLHLRYVPRYDDYQIKRLSVLPGITGWAQINGRNSIEWSKKFEYDVWYVNNCSFLVDLKIIFRTVLKVFFASNVNSSNSETMSEFMGGKND